MKFIRTLYGSDFENSRPKILTDIHRSFKQNKEFASEKVLYYVMGFEAESLLKRAGAKNIVRVTDEPIKRVSGGVLSWNKVFLIRKAVRDHGEVLYTDMDTFPQPDFDEEEAVELLRGKVGLGRLMQMPLISYVKPYFFFRPPRTGLEWETRSPAIGLFGCFMYFSCDFLFDWFFEDYEELVEKWQRKAGDEQFITYSIGKRFGEMSLRQLMDNFSPDLRLIRPRCGFLDGLIDDPSKPMFRHRR